MHDGAFLSGLSGVRLGRLTGFTAEGLAQVSLPTGEALSARSLVRLGPTDAGRELALTLIEGEALVLGLIQPPLPLVEADDETLVLEGNRQVTLRCGQASLTLTADGRVVVRGTSILSRADGPNRVQGASVQLN